MKRSEVVDPREQQRMVAMLKNLRVFADLGLGGGLYRTDMHSREREDLLCDWVDIQAALPRLSACERQVVLLMGVRQWTEEEVAVYLGISQSAVHQRLWTAARQVLTGGAS